MAATATFPVVCVQMAVMMGTYHHSAPKVGTLSKSVVCVIFILFFFLTDVFTIETAGDLSSLNDLGLVWLLRELPIQIVFLTELDDVA